MSAGRKSEYIGDWGGKAFPFIGFLLEKIVVFKFSLRQTQTLYCVCVFFIAQQWMAADVQNRRTASNFVCLEHAGSQPADGTGQLNIYQLIWDGNKIWKTMWFYSPITLVHEEERWWWLPFLFPHWIPIPKMVFFTETAQKLKIVYDLNLCGKKIDE